MWYIGHHSRFSWRFEKEIEHPQFIRPQYNFREDVITTVRVIEHIKHASSSKKKTLPHVKEPLDFVIIILHNVICVFKIHEIIHHVLFLNLWNIQWKLLNCHLAAIDICMKYVIDSWRNKNWKSGFPLYVCLGLSFHLKNNNELYAIKCDCVCLI